jgi:hypothetical protein
VQESHLRNVQYAISSFRYLDGTNVTFESDKATWWGCGQHVPMVMDEIPENERCTCTPKVEKEGKQYPPQGPKPA